MRRIKRGISNPINQKNKKGENQSIRRINRERDNQIKET